MSARFIVGLKCETKEALTLTGLLDLQRQQGLLAMFEEAAAAGELEVARHDEPLELVVPGTDEVLTVTLEQLRTQTAQLKSFRRICRVCPFSVGGRVGGCVTYLPYPVSEGMEYLFWLAFRQAVERKLPQDQQPLVMLFAEKASEVLETPWADLMRANGHLMAPRPREVAWGPVWRRQRVTTAQLIERFFKTSMLAGDELLIHAGFLSAVITLGRALKRTWSEDEERVTALREDLAPYEALHPFLQNALVRSQPVQVWP